MLRIRFAICIVIASSALRAQVVNVESRRLSSDKPGWSGEGEFWMSYLRNQSRQFTTGARFIIQKYQEVHRYLYIADAQFIETNGQNIQSQGYFHFRYNRTYTSWLFGEHYGQLFFSRQMRIDPRITCGSGARFRILKNDSLKIFGGASVSFEHEFYPSSSGVYSSERLNFYTTLVVSRFHNISFDWMVLYQPRLFDWRDHRWQTELRLDVKISERFSLRMNASLLLDTRPAADVPTIFVNSRAGLLFRF